MRIKVLLTCIAAMALQACDGTPLPVNASAVCRGVGRELIGAEGKTWADQTKIDATLERLVRMKCLARRDFRRAQAGIAGNSPSALGERLK